MFFRASSGKESSVTEAPASLLFRSYRRNKGKIVEQADIVTPTSHNFHNIEKDLKKLVDEDRGRMRLLHEQLVHAYDGRRLLILWSTELSEEPIESNIQSGSHIILSRCKLLANIEDLVDPHCRLVFFRCNRQTQQQASRGIRWIYCSLHILCPNKTFRCYTWRRSIQAVACPTSLPSSDCFQWARHQQSKRNHCLVK